MIRSWTSDGAVHVYTDTATYVIRGKMPALDERIASVATGAPRIRP